MAEDDPLSFGPTVAQAAAGGGPGPATRWVTDQPLSLDALLCETEDPRCGALQVFGGTVRQTNEGREVDGMTYEAHVVLAAKTLRELEVEVMERFDVHQCRIQHRTGALAIGEVSVYVVVRSAHRGPSFDAGRYAIDTLKERVTIWKREHYVEGDERYLDGVPLRPDPSTKPDDRRAKPATESS